MLDKDGYPTEETLQKIRDWDMMDPWGVFEFIKKIWEYRDWGWTEKHGKSEITGKSTIKFYISTAGWSGNEDLIDALRESGEGMIWIISWISHRRGGHYEFELSDKKDA